MSQPFDLCVMPASVLVGLFEKLNVQVDEACLFSPLLTGQFNAAETSEMESILAPYDFWKNGAPTDEARRAVRAVAMPRKEYEINLRSPTNRFRFFAYSNSKDVAIATFGDNDEVGISRPLSFNEFLGIMLEQVGSPDSQTKNERALKLDVPTFSIIGQLVELGLGENPMSLEDLEAHFDAVFKEKENAEKVFDALVEDDILRKENGAYEISNLFKGWANALQSNEELQISRTDLVGGKVDLKASKETAAFFGSRGQRYCMLPYEAGSGKMLLCHPDTKNLRLVMGALLGESTSTDIASNIPISPR